MLKSLQLRAKRQGTLTQKNNRSRKGGIAEGDTDFFKKTVGN